MKMLSHIAVFLCLAVATPVLADDKTPNVLFDEAHNQKFVIDGTGELQLTKLGETFRSKGIKLATSKKPLAAETLAGYDALVISGPFAHLEAAEVDAVLAFVKNGGRLALMLHIGPPLSGLLNKLDIDHSNMVIREQEGILNGDPINYKITSLQNHPLLNGLSFYSVYGGWAFNPGSGVSTIASSGKRSWVDLDGDKKLSKGDAMGPFAVLVTGKLGSGSSVVFSDDAIFQNKFLDADNTKLAENLASWLAGN